MVNDKESVRIDTLSWNTFIPVSTQRNALASAGEEDSKSPCANETVENEREFLELGCREDAAIEADQGDLDGGT